MRSYPVGTLQGPHVVQVWRVRETPLPERLGIPPLQSQDEHNGIAEPPETLIQHDTDHRLRFGRSQQRMNRGNPTIQGIEDWDVIRQGYVDSLVRRIRESQNHGDIDYSLIEELGRVRENEHDHTLADSPWRVQNPDVRVDPRIEEIIGLRSASEEDIRPDTPRHIESEETIRAEANRQAAPENTEMGRFEPAPDVHVQNVQTENVQTENVQTENVQTENVQTENVQTENV